MTRIRRLAAGLAGLTAALLVFAMAAPAALASGQRPPPGHIHQPVHQPPVPAPAHTAITGGMAGWQIALIATGAALAAAAIAILADRAWAAHKTHATAA